MRWMPQPPSVGIMRLKGQEWEPRVPPIPNPFGASPHPNIGKRYLSHNVKATILTPNEYLGNLLKLLNDRRGLQVKMDI